jgi:hypothetical protein
VSASGERRLPACSRRQLADDIPVREQCSLREELFGKLPKRTGWQPVLPGASAMLAIVGSTIPKLSVLASSFGVAFECMIREWTGDGMVFGSGSSLLGQNDCRVTSPIFDELSEAIPGIILKAA